MSDYKCTDWVFSGEPVPETIYSEGQAFSVAVDFTQGSRADYIKRLGNMVVVTAGLSPDGFGVYNASSSVVGPASGSSVSFNVHAPYSGAVTFSGLADYATAPVGTDPADVRFTAHVAVETPTGSTDVGAHIAYAPDIGPFNPTIAHDFPFKMNYRARSTDAADYDWEWYSAANFGTYGYDGVNYTTTAPTFIANEQTSPQDDVTYYLRAKMKTDSVWVNIGAVIFHDSRSVG